MGDVYKFPTDGAKTPNRDIGASSSAAKDGLDTDTDNVSNHVVVIITPRSDASWLVFGALIVVCALLGFLIGGGLK